MQYHALFSTAYEARGEVAHGVLSNCNCTPSTQERVTHTHRCAAVGAWKGAAQRRRMRSRDVVYASHEEGGVGGASRLALDDQLLACEGY
eukprot:6200298-Pleurochrysis_carterae.AAC.1